MLKKMDNRGYNLFPCRIILICMLMVGSMYSMGQNYEDTTVIVEGIKDEPPAEETNYDDESDEQKEADFLRVNKSDTLLTGVRRLPDSLVKKMQADDDFWYANAEFEKRKAKPASNEQRYIPIGQQAWFKTLMWLVIIAVFAAAIIFYLADSNVGLFRRTKKVKETEQADEEMPEDIFAINYQREIDKATAQRNYRLAVRLMFLRLLKSMSERNIILYQQDKTNLDYLMQLHNTTYYKDFFRITRNYEYSWYGKFDVSEEAYRLIRKDFDQLETGM